MAHDVFISYSRKDSEIVDKIEEELGKYGITYFIDRSAISLGDDFAEVIGRSVAECELFLFVWSENSNNSPDAANEIIMAINFQKTIIPFKIGEFKLRYSLIYHLGKLNRIETTDFNASITTELCKNIAKTLGKQLKQEPQKETNNTQNSTSESSIVEDIKNGRNLAEEEGRRYDILQNKEGEILVIIKQRKGGFDNPRFIYDGKEIALLYRSKESSVFLEGIGKEAGAILMNADKVIVAEIDNEEVAREYEVPVRIVRNMDAFK